MLAVGVTHARDARRFLRARDFAPKAAATMYGNYCSVVRPPCSGRLMTARQPAL